MHATLLRQLCYRRRVRFAVQTRLNPGNPCRPSRRVGFQGGGQTQKVEELFGIDLRAFFEASRQLKPKDNRIARFYPAPAPVSDLGGFATLDGEEDGTITTNAVGVRYFRRLCDQAADPTDLDSLPNLFLD